MYTILGHSDQLQVSQTISYGQVGQHQKAPHSLKYKSVQHIMPNKQNETISEEFCKMFAALQQRCCVAIIMSFVLITE